MTERTTIKSRIDGFDLLTLHAEPSGDAIGGVIVIQEIFGLTDHVAEMCDTFAAEGPAFSTALKRIFTQSTAKKASQRHGRR